MNRLILGLIDSVATGNGSCSSLGEQLFFLCLKIYSCKKVRKEGENCDCYESECK